MRTTRILLSLAVAALLLVVALVALPLNGLSLCTSPDAAGSCSPCCPAAAAHSPLRAIQTTPATPSCCDVSSGKPTPTSTLSSPAPSTVMVPPTAVEAPSAPEPSREPELKSSPPPAPSCFQTLLCVFLI